MNTILLIDIDWDKMFTPSVSLWEIMIRGTLTFWFCFLYIRFFRRGAGQLTIADLLLITLISDASQNSMAADYDSVTEGCVLVGVLLFWDYAINWLGYRSVLFSKLGQPDPVLLIEDGVMQRKNMRKELITSDELLGMLREQGVDDIKDVKRCCLEGSGDISVVEKEKK